jgi:hypothetical protein
VAPPLAPALPANNLFQYDDEDEQRRSRSRGHFYDEYNPLSAPFSIERRRIENEDNDRDKNGDNDRAEKIILAELHHLQIVSGGTCNIAGQIRAELSGAINESLPIAKSFGKRDQRKVIRLTS